ncbi:26s proteasome complex ubiquitin receptor subunit [Neofusicoccum parvum]|uniref:26s proteasome complex ubiquitin receptor subunit n=1 Tax=Neofusicoccum parvum TaxID=310453 RepID=A0ACB5SKG6_9PEZI|nr:26s proteasome complex ubiquitin receptor subunit [Neofusicoccum parvum]GME45856.1 26s proteasome complex ubiquitin receptor subunit [Neofusicoccum parvum]
MSISPLITFKAGKCEVDTSSEPWKVKADTTPGYIYLYIGDELCHFCWRPRSASVNDPELDLLMIPGDGSFVPYTGKEDNSDSDNLRSPTDGRIFALKFSSSSQRHLFWLQSKSQSPNNDASWFSPRDLRIGQIVDMLLSGEEVDVQDELRSVQNPPRGGDDDETMEDAPSGDHHRQGSGGAGAGATGGDVREEGEEAREGGADGARAGRQNDASALVQNFLNSLNAGGGAAAASQAQGNLFTTLADLLSSSTTIPVIESGDPAFIDALLSHLPPTILLLAQEAADLSDAEPNSETVQAAIQALSISQKKDILKRVLRSPQLHQSLSSLTVALRDGGLPSVGEALKIKVENGGFMRHSGVPLGGGDAVEAFLKGVKRTVEDEEKQSGSGNMDVD